MKTKRASKPRPKAAKRSVKAKVVAKRPRTAKPASRRGAAPKRPSRTPTPKAKAIPALAAPTQAPAAEDQREKIRESWKAVAEHENAIVKSQHGAPFDQRAHARATIGQHWTTRQAR